MKRFLPVLLLAFFLLCACNEKKDFLAYQQKNPTIECVVNEKFELVISKSEIITIEVKKPSEISALYFEFGQSDGYVINGDLKIPLGRESACGLYALSVAPDFETLEACFNNEDECDDKLKALYLELQSAKKGKNSAKAKEFKSEIKTMQGKKKIAKKATKEETDKHAYFNRAAKVYLDAEKLIKQQENYSHLEEIFNMYDEAKARVQA